MSDTEAMPLDSDAKLPWRTTLLCAALLVLVTAGAYWSSFRGAYVFDDGLCLLGDHVIAEWFPERPQKPTTGRARIFTHLTFVANYKLHGFQIFGYHAVNLAIHLAGGLTLFGLVRRTLLLPATRAKYERAAPWIALVVAALWLVHPLQTESVTYVVQRLESLAGLFFLLALYGLVRSHQSRWWWLWHLQIAVCVLLGSASKETVFIAPLALLLYDRVFLSRNWWEVVRSRWLLGVALLPAIAWMMRVLNFAMLSPKSKMMGFGFKGVTPWEYLRSQPGVILRYLRLTFWPQGQCLDYGWPIENDPWRIYGLGAIIVALVVATLWAVWYRPRVGYVALMFFVILAPTSSFMPIRDLAFEHRMYLPLASVVILVVLGMYELARRGLHSPIARVAVPALCAAIAVGGLTATTIKRNRVYHDPVDMWVDVTQKAPWNARGHYNLGECLVARGMLPGGMGQYRHYLLHDPKAVRAVASRETNKPVEGDLAAAIASFQRAIELDPQDASAHFNIGGVYDRAQRPEEAIFRYRETVRINKRHLNAHLNLTRLLADKGEVEEAIAFHEKALRIARKDARPYIAYSRTLSALGRHDDAAAQLRKAVELEPKNRKARYRLALELWELDQQQEAIALLREVRREDATPRDVNLALARYLALTNIEDLRRPIEGAAIAQEVVGGSKSPDIEALAVLATCQTEMGRHAEAVETIQQGLASADPEKHGEHVRALLELQGRLPVSVSAPD